jgi:hypothetical protein
MPTTPLLFPLTRIPSFDGAQDALRNVEGARMTQITRIPRRRPELWTDGWAWNLLAEERQLATAMVSRTPVPGSTRAESPSGKIPARE